METFRGGNVKLNFPRQIISHLLGQGFSDMKEFWLLWKDNISVFVCFFNCPDGGKKVVPSVLVHFCDERLSPPDREKMKEVWGVALLFRQLR